MLLRKLWRTLWRYKAQFISMVIMITLGIGMFVGFNMEWYSLETDVNEHLTATGFADYRVYARSAVMGSLTVDDLFTQDELDAVRSIEGVQEASRYLSVNTSVKGEDDVLALAVSENISVSGFTLISGEPYDPESLDGLWLSDQYAAKNGIALGDSMTLTYSGYEMTGVVKGLIKAGEFLICVPDETQLMPDFNSYGYAYISPAMLNAVKEELLGPYRLAITLMGKSIDDIDMYFQINVLSDLDKKTFTEAVDRALDNTALVLGRDETVSYAEAMGEVEEGKTMGSILPVLFLAIAVLTMVTTMHRITANEKTQIGTLKALGFRDGRIMRHYASYALMIGLMGSALGIGLGYFIGWFIMNPNSAMGTYIDMPSWRLIVPPVCWLVLVGINAFLMGIGLLSVRRMLAGTAADALRPYTPGRMRHLRIEETRAFKKLNFGTKWNLRDCFRHKARSFMTLLGILGCVILLIGGLGMRDTMNVFVNAFYEGAINYRQLVNISTDDRTAAEAFCEELGGDWSAATSVQFRDKPVSLEVDHVTRDLVRFLGEDMSYVVLEDDGAYVCKRLAGEFGLKAGDKVVVSPYGTSDSYELTIAGVLRSMSEGFVMTDAYADSIGLKYDISTIYTNEETILKDGMVLNVQSKEAIMKSFDTFMELMDIMVAALVIGAVALGIIVLYNLGTMSYVERYREMATLKVLGFRDLRIGQLLVSQNLWLTVLGIALGIPLGMWVLQYLIDALAAEYEMIMSIQWYSYAITVAITFGVSLIVGLMVARKNRFIDMVAALKAEE